MKGLLLLLCAMLSAEAAAKTTYDGFQVLSILPQTEISARYVHGLGDDVELDMWMESRFVGHESHLMVPPHRLDDITKRLTKRNIPFSVHIENVQEGLDIEARRLSKKGKAFSYDEYNTLEDIYAEIENLAANCPAGYTCETYDIGETTVEGNTIPVLHLYGSGSDRGAIWIDSTIHAREWLAPATVFRFMRKIFNQDDAEAIDLLNKYDFYFVPMMNPDGYDWTWTNARLWRKNREPNEGSTCFGTDLNRNYATHWSESGTSTSPCSDTYHGSGPGSCLETVAVQSEIDRIGSTLTAFVSVHTYGNYWLHAWGNQVNGSCLRADDHEDLYRVANAAADSAAAIYGTRWARGNSCETIYPASGLTLEYAKDPGGCKYTFTPELRGRGFNPPPTEIDPSEEEFWAAMVAQMNEIEAIEAGKK